MQSRRKQFDALHYHGVIHLAITKFARMTMMVNSSRLRKGLLALIVLSVGIITILYWGRIDGLQMAFKSMKPRIFDSTWTWVCEERQCVRRERARKTAPRVSLASCRMSCGSVPLWPRPTGRISLSRRSVPFRLEHLQVNIGDEVPNSRVRALLREAGDIFRNNLRKLIPRDSQIETLFTEHSRTFSVTLHVTGPAANDEPLLTLKTNESYRLVLKSRGDTLNADITASTFFGARHGLETLSQLVWWDDNGAGGGSLRAMYEAEVEDKPKFAHRGILVDTSRNFLPISALRTTLDGMAASKLNVLHWHLTDSQSFPFDSPRVPEMARYGAYSPETVYTAKDIGDLAAYARVRGIRILPEIDAPAHAGNGWQWGVSRGLGNLSVCINLQPWKEFCGEPPCGQLNPDNENTYLILGKIYQDLVELTNTTDIFHLGGDEVNLNCWASTLKHFRKDVNHDQLMDKWGYFQRRALASLQAANKGSLPENVVLWSSQITKPQYVNSYLSNKIYTIQTWGFSEWRETMNLLEDDYRVIISHLDAWYFDCGFGNWRGPGQSSCNPVSSWQTVYQYRPWYTMSLPPHKMSLILGAEACLWSEQVDQHNLDMKLWPRAAAFAERLWTDPDDNVNANFVRTKSASEVQRRWRKDKKTATVSSYETESSRRGVAPSWSRNEEENLRDAHGRLSQHRERLISRGLHPEAMWPEWCNQNPSMCLDPLPDSWQVKYT